MTGLLGETFWAVWRKGEVAAIFAEEREAAEWAKLKELHYNGPYQAITYTLQPIRRPKPINGE